MLLTRAYTEQPYTFTVEIKAPRQGPVELFYDRGPEGGSDQRYDRQLLASDKFVSYEFPLARGIYRMLRLDPNAFDGHYEIRNARIEGPGGYLYTFSPYDFKPLNQIAKFEASNESARLDVVPGGTDPFLSIILPAHINLVRAVPLGLGVVALLSLISLVMGALAVVCWSWIAAPKFHAAADRYPLWIAAFTLLVTFAVPFTDRIVIWPDSYAFLGYFDPTFGGPSAYHWPGSRAPLVPFLYRYLFWNNLHSILIFNVAMTCLIPVFGYRLARLLHCGRHSSLGIAALLSLTPFYPEYAHMVMLETPGAAAVLLATCVFVLNRRKTSLVRWLVVGVVFGLTTAARSQFLIMLPLFALFLLIDSGSLPNLKGVRRFVRPGSFLAGVAAVFTLVVIGNYMCSGAAVFNVQYNLFNRGQALFAQTQFDPADQPFAQIYQDWVRRFPKDSPTTTSPGVITMAHILTGLPVPEVAGRYNSMAVRAILSNLGTYSGMVLDSLKEYFFDQFNFIAAVYQKEDRSPLAAFDFISYDRAAKIIFSVLYLSSLLAGIVTLFLYCIRRGSLFDAWNRYSLWILLFAMVAVDAVGSSMVERGENARYFVGVSPLMLVLPVAMSIKAWAAIFGRGSGNGFTPPESAAEAPPQLERAVD